MLTNDVDRTGAPANLTNVTAPTIVAQPTKGTLTVNADRTITYTPNAGSAGTDSFIYQLCDVVNPSLCDTARVSINVSSAPPVANPDSYTLAYNQPRSLTVLTNDVDRTGAPANLTNVTAPTIVAQPTKGTLTVNADRTITYTPNPGSAGTDSFIYQLCDVVNPSLCDTARVSINVLSGSPRGQSRQLHLGLQSAPEPDGVDQ